MTPAFTESLGQPHAECDSPFYGWGNCGTVMLNNSSSAQLSGDSTLSAGTQGF